MGIVARGVGLEPFGMLEHPISFYDDFGLDLEVAFLAEGWDVPPFAVGWIHVEVMDSEAVAILWIVAMSATDAFPACQFFRFVGDLSPVFRIGSN
jgi:hypothetical protein